MDKVSLIDVLAAFAWIIIAVLWVCGLVPHDCMSKTRMLRKPLSSVRSRFNDCFVHPAFVPPAGQGTYLFHLQAVLPGSWVNEVGLDEMATFSVRLAGYEWDVHHMCAKYRDILQG